MKDWHGHHAITIAVLADLQARSARGPFVISGDERALRVVCEFWAGVHNRGLREYLFSTAAAQLLVAERAFVRIGAVRVGRTLQRVRMRLAEARPLLSIDQTAPYLNPSSWASMSAWIA